MDLKGKRYRVWDGLEEYSFRGFMTECMCIKRV